MQVYRVGEGLNPDTENPATKQEGPKGQDPERPDIETDPNLVPKVGGCVAGAVGGVVCGPAVTGGLTFAVCTVFERIPFISIVIESGLSLVKHADSTDNPENQKSNLELSLKMHV